METSRPKESTHPVFKPKYRVVSQLDGLVLLS